MLVNDTKNNGAPKPSRLMLWRAERKLAMARAALEANRCEWAWFAAHEAAELAARSIHPRNGSGRERMVARLLLLAAEHVHVPEQLMQSATLLDSHYIPIQNGHCLTAPDRATLRRTQIPAFGNPGAPSSTLAVRAAEDIITFARGIGRK